VTAAEAIAERAPGFRPRLGLMLGSGLGELAERLEDRVEIPYGELPGFHVGGLAGHAGALVLGRLAGQPVAIFAGRWHVYEGIEGAAITTPLRTLKRLGAELLVLTNAAGSLRPEAGPGSLVCISDHINMLGFNPLIGPNDDAAGPRFPSLRDAYDPELRARLHAAADALGIELRDGVYLAVAGPSF
jgi:xanthosine phosphorylase